MNKYLLDFPFYTKDPDTKSALDSEILRLVHDYGTPFYLFHEKDFCENFQSLCDSFRAVYDNYIPSYSYKTNYTPYICNLVKQMGGYAEVVSDMEYTLAKDWAIRTVRLFITDLVKAVVWRSIFLMGAYLI